MRFTFQLLWIASLTVTLCACDGNGDDDDVADDDATADDDVADDDTTPGDDDVADDDDSDDPGDCVLEGTWVLTTFFCGTYDITADWFALIDSTVLEISSVAEGCSAVLTNTNAGCVETEQFLWDGVTADEVDGESLGITSCVPDGCSFGAGDEPCVVGDRAGPINPGTYTLAGDVLTVTTQDPDGLCAHLDTIQTWTRQ